MMRTKVTTVSPNRSMGSLLRLHHFTKYREHCIVLHTIANRLAYVLYILIILCFLHSINESQ